MTDQSIAFQAYPKTPRLFGGKNIVVSEKIDGTNAAIQIIPIENMDRVLDAEGNLITLFDNDIQKITATVDEYVLVSQSRNRIITPKFDNFNFAHWVAQNAEGLVHLGPGIHRGEWWGSGIQRGYGLPKGEKRFSLFAIDRYQPEQLRAVPGLATVPEIWRGRFDTYQVQASLDFLGNHGSLAAPGFMKPEGVIIYHEASRNVFKYTFDDQPKGENR